jgi:hypothetical protein
MRIPLNVIFLDEKTAKQFDCIMKTPFFFFSILCIFSSICSAEEFRCVNNRLAPSERKVKSAPDEIRINIEPKRLQELNRQDAGHIEVAYLTVGSAELRLDLKRFEKKFAYRPIHCPFESSGAVSSGSMEIEQALGAKDDQGASSEIIVDADILNGRDGTAYLQLRHTVYSESKLLRQIKYHCYVDRTEEEFAREVLKLRQMQQQPRSCVIL